MNENFYEMYPGNWCHSLLLPEEQILWTGSPQGNRWFTKEDIFLVPFSLLWCGFALFWEASVILTGIWPFALFGIPFVVIGLYMVAGRILIRHANWKKLQYAITDRRVLWKCGSRCVATNINQIPSISLTVQKDGSGTISLRDSHMPRYYRQDVTAFSKPDTTALECIPDVERVYRLLTEQMQKQV